MIITVFGLGFVGLTTALGLVHIGHKVYGLEASSGRKNCLLEGKLPFQEPYMDEVLREQLSSGNLILSAPAEIAIQESDIVFYCVGTPYGQGGAADLTALFQAVDQTLSAIHDAKPRVLVTKSTIPPSTTTDRIYPYVTAKVSHGAQICVANNPEFLREGHCWQDFIEADRIVLGCDVEWGRDMLRKLYAPMQIPVCYVSPSTSEFIKYLSNALLATLISYSNEMAQIGETIRDIQVVDAFRILHMDKRWKSGEMASYAYPGCGYGGYCLPKDTNALLSAAREHGVEPAILCSVIQTNDERPITVSKKIAAGLEREQAIGIAGLAFKPGSDDVRESPARKIIDRLKELGCENILAYDPVAMEQFQLANPDLDISYCASLDALCKKSDRIAIITAWPEFSSLAAWQGGEVIDCRYMLRGQKNG